MKVKMTYYVLYMTENGIGNRVVQVDGGIQAAGQLQAICNQIMNHLPHGCTLLDFLQCGQPDPELL